MIATLVKHGADLSQPRDMRAYLYLQSEEDATACASTLRENGFDVTTSEAKKGSWLALAHQEMIVNDQVIAQLRARLTALVSVLDGEFDGWEASPQP